MKNNPFSFYEFSLSDFRKWMKTSENNEQDKDIGEEIRCKHRPEKIYSKIEVQSGDEEEVLEALAKGGVISEVDGDLFLVDVGCGTVLIPKNLVKKVN